MSETAILTQLARRDTNRIREYKELLDSHMTLIQEKIYPKMNGIHLLKYRIIR